jgi:hypothetical protein
MIRLAADTLGMENRTSGFIKTLAKTAPRSTGIVEVESAAGPESRWC